MASLSLPRHYTIVTLAPNTSTLITYHYANSESFTPTFLQSNDINRYRELTMMKCKLRGIKPLNKKSKQRTKTKPRNQQIKRELIKIKSRGG